MCHLVNLVTLLSLHDAQYAVENIVPANYFRVLLNVSELHVQIEHSDMTTGQNSCVKLSFQRKAHI